MQFESAGKISRNTKTSISLSVDVPNYRHTELTTAKESTETKIAIMKKDFSTLTNRQRTLTAMRCSVALTAAHRSCRLSMTRMKPTPDAAMLRERKHTLVSGETTSIYVVRASDYFGRTTELFIEQCLDYAESKFLEVE